MLTSLGVSALPGDWDGQGAVRLGWFEQLPQFDTPGHALAASLWQSLTYEPRPDFRMKVEGWVATQDATRGRQIRCEVREAYAHFQYAALDIKLGKQLAIWGRADRINPTDNLTPRNFTLAMPEETDQRLGTPALKMATRWRDLSLSLFGTSGRFDGNALPRVQNSATPAWQEPRPRTKQVALKLDQTGGAFDWSISYLNGRDLQPNFNFDVMQPSQLLVTHPRIRVWGLDAATTNGNWGYRTEWAWMDTSNPSGTDWLTRRPNWFGVIGVERTFASDASLNVQMFWRHTRHHQDVSQISDPGFAQLATQAAMLWGQRDRDQYGLSVRIADRWMNDTLEGELAAQIGLARNEVAIKPRLLYRATDQVKWTLGADIYRGAQDTLFGYLKPLSGGFVEFQYAY